MHSIILYNTRDDKSRIIPLVVIFFLLHSAATITYIIIYFLDVCVEHLNDSIYILLFAAHVEQPCYRGSDDIAFVTIINSAFSPIGCRRSFLRGTAGPDDDAAADDDLG